MMLSVTGLDAGYGRVQALYGIDVEIGEGEVVTLIGANGAGKTTLLRVVSGLLPVWRGSVTFDGREINAMSSNQRVEQGIAMVPGGRMLFGPLTVLENLQLGAYCRRREPSAKIDDDLEMVFELFPVLARRTDQTAMTLSGGEQQMLAVGRALMSRPRLLLLDEPSLGLAPKVITEIFAVLDRLKAQGLTIFLVEQDAKVALSHADRGYVMRTGRIALSGTASDLIADDDVRLIYLGTWHHDDEGGTS